MIDLPSRLQPFVDQGILTRVPTRWQVFQGELEMWATVISTDVTEEGAYRPGVFGHPIFRQALLASRIGVDHFRIGTGMGARPLSVCRHLQLTFHFGMPVWDLQVLQTHPTGLGLLRATIEETLSRTTEDGLRTRAIADRIFMDPPSYLSRFLGPDGYIARAERFAYPTSEEACARIAPEHFSVVAFMERCARVFPERASDVAALRLPGHLLTLATRRFREERGLGWFARPSMGKAVR